MKYLPLLFLLAFILTSCSEENTILSPKETEAAAEVRIQELNNLAQNRITPLAEQISSSVSGLAQVLNDLGTNPVEANLVAAQIAYRNAAVSLHRYNIYDYNSSVFDARLSLYALRSFGSEIENVLADPTISIDLTLIEENVNNWSSPMRLAEYLLFTGSTTDALERFQNEQRVADLIVATGQYLDAQKAFILNKWQNYEQTFLNAPEQPAPGPQSIVVTRMVSSLNLIQSLLNEALLDFQNQGVLAPERWLGGISNSTITYIKAAFEEFTNIYTGNFSNPQQMIGIDDYLVSIAQTELGENISAAIEDLQDALDQLPLSLEETLSNNPELILGVNEANSELRRLIQLDMVNAMCLLLVIQECDCD